MRWNAKEDFNHLIHLLGIQTSADGISAIISSTKALDEHIDITMFKFNLWVSTGIDRVRERTCEL